MILSIITINFNNSAGLSETLKSIRNQTFKDIDLIVIDGGSTDESLAIIEQYNDIISYWVSERDGGIYHAQNKGIAKAVGTYCLFLNSGDFLFEDEVLEKVFKTGLSADIAYGNMKIIHKNGQEEWGNMPVNPTLQHMIQDTLWHPVSFIKRSLFETYGDYREDLKITADYDFFFKTIVVNNISTQYLPFTISVFDMTGISSSPENAQLIQDERRQIQQLYLPQSVLILLNDYYLLLQENMSLKQSFYTKIRAFFRTFMLPKSR